MKLIIAMTVTTVPVISVFTEPVAAQRTLLNSRYSVTGSDQQNVLSQFNLVNTTINDNPITDTASDPNIGFFKGAIQDYTVGRGEVCIAGVSSDSTVQPNCPKNSSSSTGRYLLDSSGFPIFNPDRPFVSTASPFDGDLKAEYIQNNTLDTAQGGTTKNTILYSILKPGEIQPVFIDRLDYSSFGLDKDQAINNLSYIIEQNLLGKSQRVAPNLDLLVGGDTLIQNRFEQDVPTTTVVEPSATLGAFIALSAGLLLKLKMKQI